MSRIILCAVILAASFSDVASAQESTSGILRSTSQAIGRRDSIDAAPSGDIALAGLLAPVRVQPIRTTTVDDSPFGLSVCAGRGQWKCILGGAAIGFVAGALIGQAFIPKEVDRTEYGCSGFTGQCGTYTICEAHCEEPVTKIWAFGAGGAVLGGIGGYYLAKATSR